MRELAGVAPIAEAEADKSRNNMYQINESLKAVNEKEDTSSKSHGVTLAHNPDNPWFPNEKDDKDDELEEGAKPDFSDIDDDGDKEETALKAAADAKDDTKTESQQMREWAKSVYETVEDLDETDGCNCGAVCSCKDADETLEEETEELAENAKATSLGKSAHKDHKRQPTSDPRLMHLMNKDGMRGNSSFNQSPYLKAWLAGYDSMAKNESQQMREESSESRPYVAVHVKKGKTDVTGTSSYGAAQAAAKKWGLKSTAGIDVHLADVKKVATEQQQMREWSNSVYQNYEDKGHIMAQPEGETVDLSLRRYLNAEPSKVQVAENHTPKSLTESYKSFKAKK
jgi:hypothetical protein